MSNLDKKGKIMTEQLGKEDLEKKKLEFEIRLLAHQEKWEFWKSIATALASLLTALALLGGVYKYFQDENIRLRLKKEEVFSIGLTNLESKDAYIRLGAVVSLLSYVDKDKDYGKRVAAVLAVHYLKEHSIVVKKTILGNFRKWHSYDKAMFDGFLEDVKTDLLQVTENLKIEKETEKRIAFEQEKSILEGLEKLLTGL